MAAGSSIWATPMTRLLNDSSVIVIVGRAVFASAVVYLLTVNPDFNGSALGADHDPTQAMNAMSLSSLPIRMQVSNPINVKLNHEGNAFIRAFARTMQVREDPAREPPSAACLWVQTWRRADIRTWPALSRICGSPRAGLSREAVDLPGVGKPALARLAEAGQPGTGFRT